MSYPNTVHDESLLQLRANMALTDKHIGYQNANEITALNQELFFEIF